MILVLEDGQQIDSGDPEALERAATILEWESLEKAVLTAEKAKKILRDGEVHGKPLTEQQRKYFGAVASGTARKSNPDGCDTPGEKIRSKGKGRGLAVGGGKGPIGVPGQKSGTGESPGKTSTKELTATLDDIKARLKKKPGDAALQTRQKAISAELGRRTAPDFGKAQDPQTPEEEERLEAEKEKKKKQTPPPIPGVKKSAVEVLADFAKVDQNRKTKKSEETEMSGIDQLSDFAKAKYTKRTGTPGNYKYEYPEDTKKPKRPKKLEMSAKDKAEAKAIRVLDKKIGKLEDVVISAKQSFSEAHTKWRSLAEVAKQTPGKDSPMLGKVDPKKKAANAKALAAWQETDKLHSAVVEAEGNLEVTRRQKDELVDPSARLPVTKSKVGGSGKDKKYGSVTVRSDGSWAVRQSAMGRSGKTVVYNAATIKEAIGKDFGGKVPADPWTKITLPYPAGETDALSLVQGRARPDKTEKETKKTFGKSATLNEWLEEQETDMSTERTDEDLAKSFYFSGKRITEWSDQFYSNTGLEAQALQCVKDMIACQKKWDTHHKAQKPYRDIEDMPRKQREAYRDKQSKARNVISKEEDAVRLRMRGLEEKLVDYRIKEAEVRQSLGKGGVEMLADFAKGDDHSAAVEVEVVKGESGTSVLIAYLDKAQGMPGGQPEKVEDQLKDKPSEHSIGSKSLAVPGHQREMVAHENAQVVSRLRKGPDDITLGPGIPTGDETAARMAKGEDFYAGGTAPTIGGNPMILTQRKLCRACNSAMAKSLAVCPHCGDGAGIPQQGAVQIAVSAERHGPILQARGTKDIIIK